MAPGGGGRIQTFEKVNWFNQGKLKGGSITVLLTSCLTSLDYFVLQIKTEKLSCHTADSKRVKQEVNGTLILPPLVFHGLTLRYWVKL